MQIETTSDVNGGLLLMGVPFPQGKHGPLQALALVTEDEEIVPSWWTPRAFWPDGSLKWIWLHARVPEGHARLQLVASDHSARVQAPVCSAHGQQAQCATPDGRIQFKADATTWTLQAEGIRLTVQDSPDVLEPRANFDVTSGTMELLEPSPIAPLFRFRHPVADGWRREYLFRVDPEHNAVDWTRRVTLLSASNHQLKEMRSELHLSAGDWQISGMKGCQSLRVHSPHRMQVDDALEQVGNPKASLLSEQAAVWIEKGWQRAPFGLDTQGSDASVHFYPATAPSLTVLRGTSFRHDLRAALGEQADVVAHTPVRWSWDSDMLAETEALGLIAPRNKQVQRLFPGFDRAFQGGIEQCRPTRLDKPDGSSPGPAGDLADETTHDEEFFGLQHYGDWPMRFGSYGGTQRMYCDNEYDVAYALFQHFARTGQQEILDLARHSAIHMTDVDFLAHSGDMRYHGYHAQAEDHQGARVGGGDKGHVWADGYWCLYLLYGDPFAQEAALALTQKQCRDFDGEDDDTIRRYFTGCERSVGWPMVAMCAQMELAPDDKTMAILEHMSDYVAKYMRDPEAEFEGIDHIGGNPAQWWRCAALDGSKPFMLGVLMEGLERYHRLSGSEAAREALLSVACFLRDVMWDSTVGAFIYELNAYNRGHRGLYPHYINLLVTRGLAYAYELTGDESFRTVTEQAAYGGLWTVFETTGGKEIGMVGRTSGATMTYMLRWWHQDQVALAAAQPRSTGIPFTLKGTPKECLARPELAIVKGTPRFSQDALICDTESFAICEIEKPWNTGSGHVLLDFAPERAVQWDGGGNSGPGWGILHLCNESILSSAVTVMHFYDGLHVRFYDRHRKIIDVLEANVEGWAAGERRQIEFAWDEQEAVLWLNGEEAHRIPMQRRLAGEFRRLYLGCKPGNWKGKGTLHRVAISLR